jgi:hypothetical protein
MVSIYRFLPKNLLQCDTPHLQSISNRTLRAYTGSFTLVKIFIWGVQYRSAQKLKGVGRLSTGRPTPCPLVAGVSVAVARLLVRIWGLAPISAQFNLIIFPNCSALTTSALPISGSNPDPNPDPNPQPLLDPLPRGRACRSWLTGQHSRTGSNQSLTR